MKHNRAAIKYLSLLFVFVFHPLIIFLNLDLSSFSLPNWDQIQWVNRIVDIDIGYLLVLV